ncbi:MAG: ATP synthase F0 subunit B [Treponema sp.]|nr:ATP synthase F0 subunit B [Treponema sp.]
MLDFSITFLFTLLNIGVLFFILRLILFKPVTKLMEERAAKVRREQEEAGREKEEAGRLHREYQELLQNARAEKEALITAAREAAEARAERIIQDGKGQAERLVAGARSQIAAERSAAFSALKAEAAALVLLAASRLVRREISGEDSLRQAEFLLQEIGKR